MLLYIIVFQLSSYCRFKATNSKQGGYTMSQQHTKAEKRTRRKRYQERVRARINEAKAAAKKK